MDVIGVPSIKINKISNDIIQWEMSYQYYKYIFSEEAKFKNILKYHKCIYESNKESERVQDEIDGENYRAEKRYEDQSFIDDAFGGEEDAYWNID